MHRWYNGSRRLPLKPRAGVAHARQPSTSQEIAEAANLNERPTAIRSTRRSSVPRPRPACHHPAVTEAWEFALEQPRAHRNRAVVEWKLSRLDEPHVAPLNRFVRELRGRDRAERRVPWFDPAGGGIHAPVVMLLEAPGPKTVDSMLVSADNDDPTAAAVHRFQREAGLRRDQVVAWNVVPWYIGDGSRIRGAATADLREAAAHLNEFLSLVQQPAVVLLCGRNAQKGWLEAAPYFGGAVLHTPHPSARGLMRPGAREQFQAALREAREIARR
jgi:uracil-DNA glycosylase